MRHMALVVLVLPAACSEEKSLFPNCAPNQVVIQGSLDFGQPDAGPPPDAAVDGDAAPPGPGSIDYGNYRFEQTIEASGYSFVDVDGKTAGHLDIVFAGGATRLIIDFTTPLDPGGEVEALAQFQTEEINIGNCLKDGFNSTLTLSANESGGRFTLAGLREYMYCMGMEVPGTLYGCYSAPQ